jgi:hypothetical protein
MMDIAKIIDNSTKMGIPISEVHTTDNMDDVSFIYINAVIFFYLQTPTKKIKK